MKKPTRFILVILSSILLSLPWFQQFSGIIIIIAFIPLLFLEDYIYKTRTVNKPIVLIAYSSLAFCIWNILTTYWIYNAAFIAVLAAVIVNTILFTTIFWLFHFTRRKLGSKLGYFAFVIYWIGFEHFYLNAEISWPWLNLGNALAKDIKLIQWYEYTGTLGGTLWILLLNLFLYKIFKSSIHTKNIKNQIPQLILYLLLLIIPITISLSIFSNYKEKGKDYNIAVLQPNIDPYNDKFGGLSQAEQFNIIMNLADSIIDDTTDYVIGPETALSSIWIHELNKDYNIHSIKRFVRKNPEVNFIIGMDCYKRFKPSESLSPTARYWKEANIYYDAFNSALQIDANFNMSIYHKSKLVVGVEKIPYPGLMKFLEKIILNLGGTTGSRGTQDFRGTFKHAIDETRIAPVICYESVYGEFVTDYVKNGANLIFVITNDGWWGNTSGYKQHLTYSQLRAIETRRSIARSANTGISAFINQKGEILNKTNWWVADAIKNTVKANTKLTFYVRYGDYIGRLAKFLTIITLLYTIVQSLLNKSLLKKKK